MKPLSHESRALLEAACGREGPSATDRKRIRGRISARIAAGLALGPAVSAGATAAEAAHVTGLATMAAWLPGVAKVVTVAAIAGGVTVGAVHVAHRPSPSAQGTAAALAHDGPTRAQAPHVVARAPASASVAAVTSSVVETAPEASIAVVAIKMQPAAKREASVPSEIVEAETQLPVPAPPSDNGLTGEIAAIREARAAIRFGNGRAALSALNRNFVAGQSSPLAQEATLVRVSALCLIGDTSAARRTAEQFLASYPESPLCSKIRSTCAFP